MLICAAMAAALWNPVASAQSEGGFDYLKAAGELREVTGARTRFIWTKPVRPVEYMQFEDGLELWGLDTDDGKGARKIGEVSSYHRPLLTADGERVVWTNYQERTVNVIGFDGTGERKLLDFAQMGAVWRDPDTGLDWFYYRDTVQGEPERENQIYTNGSMWRAQIDDPEVKELMWDRTGICHGTLFYLSLTQDGKYAASAFPWASNGIAQLPNVAQQQIHFGCWSGISPDNSGRFFSFDGDHRFLHLFDWGGVNRRDVRIDTMPEHTSGDVYYPRWTNHPDFMVVSHQGFTYLARFNEDFSGIANYTLVANEQGNIPRGNWLGFPDAWIDPGPDFKVASTDNLLPLDAVAPVDSDWPGEMAGLTFAWKNRAAPNRAPTPDGGSIPIELESAGIAAYGPDWQMQTHDGRFMPNSEEPARRIVEAVKEGAAFTVELVVEPTVPRQDGTILALDGLDGVANLRLYQWLNRVNIELPRTVVETKGKSIGEPRRIFSLVLPGSGPAHIVFAYEAGRLDVYLNGEYVDSAFVAGFHKWETDDFAPWSDEAKLVFGSRADASDPWRGRLDGIAFFNRALPSVEARVRYQLYEKELTARTVKPVHRRINARLVAISGTPSDEDMGIYSRALIANEYEVLRVVKGEPMNGKIVVQHPAVFDRKALPIVAEWEVGKEYELSIEPLEDHPQLEGERIFDDLDNFESPTFLDVGVL